MLDSKGFVSNSMDNAIAEAIASVVPFTVRDIKLVHQLLRSWDAVLLLLDFAAVDDRSDIIGMAHEAKNRRAPSNANH